MPRDDHARVQLSLALELGVLPHARVHLLHARGGVARDAGDVGVRVRGHARGSRVQQRIRVATRVRDASLIRDLAPNPSLEVDESKRLALDDDGEADLVREGVREGVDGGGARGDLGVEQAPPLVSPGFRIVGVEMVGVVGVRVFVFGGKRRRDLRCGGFPRVARGGGRHQPGGHGEPAREPPERGHLSPELSRLRRGQVAGRRTRACGGRCAARCPCRGRLGLVLLRLDPRPRVGGVLNALQDLRALLVALPPGELERGADRPRGILQVLARVVEPLLRPAHVFTARGRRGRATGHRRRRTLGHRVPFTPTRCAAAPIPRSRTHARSSFESRHNRCIPTTLKTFLAERTPTRDAIKFSFPPQPLARRSHFTKTNNCYSSSTQSSPRR